MASVDAPDRRGLTVVLVGAECSGKTTLARQLARDLGAPWIAEYARAHLSGRSGYTAADVLTIAQQQWRREHELTATGHSLLIVDTDLVVTKVWSEIRFGRHEGWIDAALRAEVGASRRRGYLVPRPDLPWVADPLRENPTDRDTLHERYVALLDQLAVPYQELTGSRQQRLTQATHAVRRWLR